MKKIDRTTLIRFLADDLHEEEMNAIRQRIETDADTAEEVQALRTGIQKTENVLDSHAPDLQPPPYYWNSFNPRLNERMEQRRRSVKRFKRFTFITAPALGMAALFLIFFRIPGDTELQPARDWLYSIYPDDTVESLLNSKYLSADEFLNSISLTGYDTGTLEEFFNTEVSDPSESVYLEPIDEFQKLESSQQDEILKELAKTEFI